MTESAATESVQFDQEVPSDVEVFREVLGVEGPDVPLPRLPRRLFLNGLQRMDGVDIRHVFHRRLLVMNSVTKFMQGAFRGGLRVLMEEISAARLARDVLRQFRAWKASLLLPRMLLHKPPRGGLIPKRRLEERLELFARCDCMPLLRASEQAAEAGAPSFSQEGTTARSYCGEASCPRSTLGTDGRALAGKRWKGQNGHQARWRHWLHCLIRSGGQQNPGI